MYLIEIYVGKLRKCVRRSGVRPQIGALPNRRTGCSGPQPESRRGLHPPLRPLKREMQPRKFYRRTLRSLRIPIMLAEPRSSSPNEPGSGTASGEAVIEFARADN